MFSVSVDSGMEVLTTANAGEALSSWPSRYYMDCSPCTNSAVLYQRIPLWMLKWVVVGCLVTICNNGWKSAHVESVQLFNELRIEIMDRVLLQWDCSSSSLPN